MKHFALITLSLLVLVGCSTETNTDTHIKVASHTAPMTTVLEIAKEELAKEGYDLEIVYVSDNTSANTALNAKEVDANFFQHAPFMNQFNEANDATLVAIQPIYDAKVAFYSKTLQDIKDLPENAVIAVPSDGVNQTRALRLLEANDLITSTKKEGAITIYDLEENSYTWKEVDLLNLNQAYEEVDLVFNYPTYIKAINLTPNENGLLVEEDPKHPYAISLVAREDNKEDIKIQKLKEAMTSTAVEDFLTNADNSPVLVTTFN